MSQESLPRLTADVQILIFAAREDPFDGWGRAKMLEADLIERGLEPTFVNRLAANLESLTLVAKHRIVKSPAIVVLKKSKQVARFVGVPIAEAVVKWIGA